MIAGVLSWLFLPDFPRSGRTKWLTDQEQRFAEWRLARSANDEVDENGGIRAGLKDAFTDPKVWLLVSIQVCLLTAQSWTYFFPVRLLPIQCQLWHADRTTQSIVSTLGFSSMVTLLITAPVYFFGFFTSLGNSILAQYTNKRAILIAWPQAVDIVGNLMVILSTSTAVRYTGMYLMCAGSYSAFNVVQAWIASTVPRTRTKRAVTYALVNLMGNSANIYGSYFFPSKDAPQYRTGGIILSCFAAGGIILAGALGVALRRLNKQAKEEEARTGIRQYMYVW
jgi:hypothetical protein